MAKETTTRKKVQATPDEAPNVDALMQAIADLKNENRFLKGKLNEASEQFKLISIGEVYKRLDLLWKIITLKGADEIFGDDFMAMTINDFKEIMFPPEPEKEEENV